ncbi:MAG TPA: tetratricopeptide repeat-containing glycosyltransferase family protein [Nitrospira sp.]
MEKPAVPVKWALPPQQQAVLGIPAAMPKNAFYEATEMDRAGRHEESERVYQELLNADFDNPVLHAALGMNFCARERHGVASILLRKALENISGMMAGFKRLGVTPKSDLSTEIDNFFSVKRSEILNALGTCYKHENKTEEARRFFEEAQSHVPPNADIQNNLGTLYINEGKPEKALEHLDYSLLIDPTHPQAAWNKSLAHLELGDYKQGWPLYDRGFDAKVRYERNYTPPNIILPRWKGEPEKNLIVYGEQGIGDEIMFASCLNEVIRMSNLVVVDCHKKLKRLFASSFPGIDIYGTREDQQIQWSMNPDGTMRYPFDARVASGSLPGFFRPTLDSFPGTPFIHPEPDLEAAWAVKLSKLGPRPKVGISWAGGHKRTRVEVRSMRLEQMLPILQQDADFISLQYTDCHSEILELEKKHGIKVHYFPEATHSPDYADTAALVANLDLVITVCTSVVHLAGAMGVPTWVLTPSRPAWRYRLDLDYMPWYGRTVTLFRQAPETTDWTPVVAEVSESFNDLVGATHVQS